MILPDVNLLLYAHDTSSRHHRAAMGWWNGVLAGSEGVGLAWVTTLGFVRLITSPRVFLHPMRPEDVMERLAEWLQLPHFHFVTEADNHLEKLRSLLTELGTAGNLTTDAHLATLAITRGYVLQSCDSDFARFPGLRWENPLV